MYAVVPTLTLSIPLTHIYLGGTASSKYLKLKLNVVKMVIYIAAL
jgi:hypothetical protein